FNETIAVVNVGPQIRKLMMDSHFKNTMSREDIKHMEMRYQGKCMVMDVLLIIIKNLSMTSFNTFFINLLFN
ncbi:hypothetical protein L9F63_023357, partial [Diploptera punctata]